jgi:hypothetical protein
VKWVIELSGSGRLVDNVGMEATFEQITPHQLAEFLEQPKKAYDYWLVEALDNPNLEPFLEKLTRTG